MEELLLHIFKKYKLDFFKKYKLDFFIKMEELLL